jgi:2-haloacid dehalogenase
MIEAVIFDIGNVLIEWQPERWFDAKIGAARRREMFAATDLHGVNDLVDQGYDFKRTIYDAADKFPEFAAEIRMWHDNWLELAQPAIPHSAQLLRALRQRGIPVFALSNFGIGTFEIAEKEYPVLTEFDRRYVSGYMGCVKPHAQIYQMLEEDCGVTPQNMLFTDDRQENLDTAAARGWQTHLFTSAEGWAARLVAEGLLNESESRP